MPLEPINGSAFLDPDANGIIFTMMDVATDDTIAITVTAGALQKLGGKGEPLTIFDDYHSVLEAAASNKFDAGSGEEITIEAVDLVGG